MHNPAEAAPIGASSAEPTTQHMRQASDELGPRPTTESAAEPVPSRATAFPRRTWPAATACWRALEDWLLESPPLHANWALTGLRGTGKTVLLGEFAAAPSAPAG